MKTITLIFVVLLLAGCADPFSSRESQPPTSDAGTFIQPVSPQIVLINLQKSYEELIVANFVRCLDSNFLYHYDFAESQVSEFDTAWLFSEELRITESIFSIFLSDSTLSLELNLQTLTDRQDESYGDSAVLYRSYTLSIITDLDNQAADTAQYVGTSTFTMLENQQGLWNIITWEDHHQATDNLSWTDYKNGYR